MVERNVGRAGPSPPFNLLVEQFERLHGMPVRMVLEIEGELTVTVGTTVTHWDNSYCKSLQYYADFSCPVGQ